MTKWIVNLVCVFFVVTHCIAEAGEPSTAQDKKISANASSWNSLEVVKIVSTVLTPIVLLVLGSKINSQLSASNHRYWTNQKVIEKRLEIFDEISSDLNDLFCFFKRVGRWKELTPPEVLERKRKLDRTIYVNALLFPPEFLEQYKNFRNMLFTTHTGTGQDAKLRTEIHKRKLAFKGAWQSEWDSEFDETKVHTELEIEVVYKIFQSHLTASLGVETSP